MRYDYPEIIGHKVSGIIDRPMGSRYPHDYDMICPINYGYVPGVMAEDGEEQNVYLLGARGPLTAFEEGTVIAVYRRENDIEDIWIVSLDGSDYEDWEILSQIEFQEQYYDHGWLLR